ncbi:winged helix-turn-helix domain-containing protein [Enterobacter cloacae]|uniref:winged helix-turn-helix domain-containing protein n=1 Tax=Enterobacter cloacae TaxID=550 RepID=UPI00345D55A8
MNYIINAAIVYAPEIKQLSLLNDDASSVVLSNQAARLLIVMMKNNKAILAREDLLKMVWEDFGSTPSNNNLYMAVSELRKAFKNLGLTDQIISTLPKTGFIFEAEIDIIQSSSPQPVFGEKIKQKKTGTGKSPLIIFAGGLLIMLIIISLTFCRNNVMGINKDYLHQHFSLNKCTIYPLGKETEQDKQRITEYLSTDIARKTLGVDCSETKSSVFYQIMPPPINEIFIANCSGEIPGRKAACKNLRTEND